MNCKVDLRNRLLVLNCANGVVHLGISTVLDGGGNRGLAFGVHAGRRREKKGAREREDGRAGRR